MSETLAPPPLLSSKSFRPTCRKLFIADNRFITRFTQSCYNRVMDTALLTMRQVSAKLNIPSRKIRNYCTWGLLNHVRHNKVGRRIFTAEQLDQIALLYGLQKAGFNRAQLKQYARTQDPTLQKSLLATQKRQLWQELENIKSNIDFIERQEELLG